MEIDKIFFASAGDKMRYLFTWTGKVDFRLLNFRACMAPGNASMMGERIGRDQNPILEIWWFTIKLYFLVLDIAFKKWKYLRRKDFVFTKTQTF